MGKKKKCKDHQGQEFNSIREMCDHWNVTYKYFDKRRSRGMSLEDCLTYTVGITSVDHLGNEFNSKSAMCKYWNRSIMVYNSRIAEGCSIEEALTGEYKPHGWAIPCKDHLGQEFPSREAMARHWGLGETNGGYKVMYRLRRGWTLEEALTGKIY